jgi:hypothetical protein
VIRIVLILAAVLILAFAARGDGIWSGGGVIGNDGIANKNAVGINGVAAISATSVTTPVGNCGVGALDLSTGCAQLVAFGVLF